MADQQSWLEGITVLDITRYLAGPAVTRLLTELGADVIKIEQPPYGDPNRSNRPRINRRAGAHIQQNRGKRSVCLDINTDEGAGIIRDLVPHVDVVVENFSPGVMARKGLAYEDLKAIKPDIIMASVSGFGQTGPLSERPCFDIIAQGYSGFMHMTGDPDGPPMFTGSAVADSNVGVHGFAAIGHALFHRERTGRGTHLDVAMLDSLFHFHEQVIHGVSMDPDFHDARQGRDYPTLSPAGAFQGPEGWITILCTEWQMKNLWAAMGQPELADDPRFVSNPVRIENREVLTELIEAWMATFDTDEQLLDALAGARVPAGPVLTPRDTISHPHFVERGVVRFVEDPLAGTVAIPGFPFKSSDPFPPDDHQAPALGEHNGEVLSGMLGISDDRLAELAEAGVIASKPH
ncbi:MAG: CaiB/BaiF CoA transferase family protein [Acidimicrobiales bacterium]